MKHVLTVIIGMLLLCLLLVLVVSAGLALGFVIFGGPGL